MCSYFLDILKKYFVLKTLERDGHTVLNYHNEMRVRECTEKGLRILEQGWSCSPYSRKSSGSSCDNTSYRVGSRGGLKIESKTNIPCPDVVNEITQLSSINQYLIS